jgi:hypothetical protein
MSIYFVHLRHLLFDVYWQICDTKPLLKLIANASVYFLKFLKKYIFTVKTDL